VLHALASEHRVKIVQRLREEELSCKEPEQCDFTARCCDVAELARHVECSLPTLSYHLKELRYAGLVASHRHGRQVYYGIRSHVLRTTLHQLLKEA
jgi:DNA-binding transcriptional ArsR family regulator